MVFFIKKRVVGLLIIKQLFFVLDNLTTCDVVEMGGVQLLQKCVLYKKLIEFKFKITLV